MKTKDNEPKFECPKCDHKIREDSHKHGIGRGGYLIPYCVCGVCWTEFETEENKNV